MYNVKLYLARSGQYIIRQYACTPATTYEPYLAAELSILVKAFTHCLRDVAFRLPQEYKIS